MHGLLLNIAFICIIPYAWAKAPPLNLISIATTPNGFDGPARGWNSYGLQANPDVDPSFLFDEAGVKLQANALANLLTGEMKASHDYYISLDSGWSDGSSGDEHGRIIYNETLFKLSELADYLHGKGLKLGVYVLPGAFCSDENKTISGTGTKIKTIFSKPITNNGFARCDLDFNKPATQTWHDTVVDLFASW
jgi:alpha-galactosidase